MIALSHVDSDFHLLINIACIIADIPWIASLPVLPIYIGIHPDREASTVSDCIRCNASGKQNPGAGQRRAVDLFDPEKSLPSMVTTA